MEQKKFIEKFAEQFDETDGLINSQWIADRLVNLPSSVRI